MSPSILDVILDAMSASLSTEGLRFNSQVWFGEFSKVQPGNEKSLNKNMGNVRTSQTLNLSKIILLIVTLEHLNHSLQFLDVTPFADQFHS